MNNLSSKPIPTDYQRVLLVNPTKFLGNLLIAGDLIQEFHRFCTARNVTVLIIVDERFKGLLKGLFPDSALLFYPRKKINSGSLISKVSSYYQCLKQIRAFKADLAFNLEEDAVCSRLTQFSAAKFKLGCSKTRHRWGYDHILSIDFSRRPSGRQHRWHSYYDVFSKLRLPEPELKYLSLAPRLLSAEIQAGLVKLGVRFTLPIVALHVGASKDYKKWPLINYVQLAIELVDNGYQPVFVGKGELDKSATRAIMNELNKQPLEVLVVDLVDQLNLAQLASFLILTSAMVGNDSGPFHLSSSLGVPGCVIFGPTDQSIWRPLSRNSIVMTGPEACDPGCNKRECKANYRCLSSIRPAVIIKKILEITSG